jgi:hypothetical protein
LDIFVAASLRNYLPEMLPWSVFPPSPVNPSHQVPKAVGSFQRLLFFWVFSC